MTFRGLFAWLCYWLVIYACRIALVVIFGEYMSGWEARKIVYLTLGLGLLAPARYFQLWLRVKATASKAKANAMEVAQQIDDMDDLAAVPDGTVVSLVGWVRGHAYLLHRVGGQQAVGMAMHCRGQHLVETLHNFDLLEDSGRSALVLAAGARMMGTPNVLVSRADDEDRAAVHALDLPAGIVPTYWSAFVVRDGDPVMVIGIKSTVHDMTELQHGRPAQRTAVGSDPRRPLLVFPLDAERMDV